MPKNIMQASKAKKSILLFSPRLDFGGSELTIISLSNGLVEREIDVTLLVLSVNSQVVNYLDSRVTLVDLKKPRLLRAVRAFFSFLTKNRGFDVYFSSMTYANIYFFFLVKLSKPRAFVALRLANSFVFEGLNGGVSRLEYLFAPFVYRRANLVIVPIKEMIQETISAFKLTTTPLAIPNPCQLKYRPPTSSIELHENFAAALDNGPVFLSVGRLEAQKDFVTLLRAFNLTRSRVTNSTLWIIGEGSQLNELKKLRKELNLESEVFFLGHCDNPTAYMNKSTIFVSASKFEAAANALSEALASYCRVVSTNAPYGASELLQNGRFGRLVNVGDVRALAEAMLASIKDKVDLEDRRIMLLERTLDGFVDRFEDALF